MFSKKCDEKVIDLFWELLLHEMNSISQIYNLQISHKFPHFLSLDIVSNPWNFHKIIFSTHHQQNLSFNLWIAQAQLFMFSPKIEPNFIFNGESGKLHTCKELARQIQTQNA
uniref:Uncharacterized protein n=1 Tax=Cucumis melo TaxID=3656 RepID=A0A9I9EM73_CUCME